MCIDTRGHIHCYQFKIVEDILPSHRLILSQVYISSGIEPWSWGPGLVNVKVRFLNSLHSRVRSLYMNTYRPFDGYTLHFLNRTKKNYQFDKESHQKTGWIHEVTQYTPTLLNSHKESHSGIIFANFDQQEHWEHLQPPKKCLFAKSVEGAHTASARGWFHENIQHFLDPFQTVSRILYTINQQNTRLLEFGFRLPLEAIIANVRWWS